MVRKPLTSGTAKTAYLQARCSFWC